ncbi:MAG: nucleotidyltransferase domain-containing protein [Prevotella sp.]|nr:nucleotidyltransferase domain-containing protein [Staphylococcus sp.]MCM1350604.1 nucleotidyltransferase domain-containing protein [Prevotella sp.]
MLEQLENEIDKGLIDISIEEILLMCEAKSLFFNQVYAPLSKENLILLLRANQKAIQDNYPIQNMWLYGSFAREEQTEYSDIDMMVEAMSEFNLRQLKDYLTTLCKRPVDIKIYQPAVSFFSKDAIQERICIFSENK